MTNKAIRATKPEAKKEAPSVLLDWNTEGTLKIETAGSWDGILQAAGNTSVSNGLITQIAQLGSPGNRIDQNASNFALGFVASMKPKDAAEALLLAQMAATHQAVMTLSRHLTHAESIPQKDCAEKALNKTARTFAAQMDTLKRYRSKGQQVVRVERVTVNDGGQAIVGAVSSTTKSLS